MSVIAASRLIGSIELVRKWLYNTIEEVQSDLDQWLKVYNQERTHQKR